MYMFMCFSLLYESSKMTYYVLKLDFLWLLIIWLLILLCFFCMCVMCMSYVCICEDCNISILINCFVFRPLYSLNCCDPLLSCSLVPVSGPLPQPSVHPIPTLIATLYEFFNSVTYCASLWSCTVGLRLNTTLNTKTLVLSMEMGCLSSLPVPGGRG